MAHMLTKHEKDTIKLVYKASQIFDFKLNFKNRRVPFT